LHIQFWPTKPHVEQLQLMAFMTLELSQQRLIFILAGPSGAGKNTLIKSLLNRVDNINQLPSVTTRPPRPDEEENVHHLFVSEQEFIKRIFSGEFIEWKIAYEHYYGTMKMAIAAALDSDHDHIADIDIWGAIKIKEENPRNIVIIFIKTSTLDILEQRLRHRGMLTEQQIMDRLATAQRELACEGQSDYIISNDKLQNAVKQLTDIIRIERNRVANRE
jgi:guanylate kinase